MVERKMNDKIVDIFKDKSLVNKIQNKLPKLFHIAELESSRAGKIGMEVGAVREKIVIALLIYKFGEENVETTIPITEPEMDVKVFGNPISIKTITGNNLNGVKLIWTVDAKKALEFMKSYQPSCDIVLVQINWNNIGALYYIPINAQVAVFNRPGRNTYIKLPKKGTNPRGVELTAEALQSMINHNDVHKIEIKWTKEKVNYLPYKRWVDMWIQD